MEGWLRIASYDWKNLDRNPAITLDNGDRESVLVMGENEYVNPYETHNIANF